MVGSNFSENTWNHVYIDETFGKYSNINLAHIKNSIIKQSDFSGSSMQEIKFKEFYLKDTNLTGTSLFRTKLQGIDLSTCMIEGIVVKIEDLKGCIVTAIQALSLAELMGIIIK